MSDASLSVDLSITTNGTLAMASIQPKQAAERSPCDVVCVVDVSGSMGAAATLKNSAGHEENTGLTVLDVVKHAIKTIIAALDARDRLSLVAFNDKGEVKLDLTAMSKDGREKASTVTENLRSGGSTNIWDGLLRGLEVLRAVPSASIATTDVPAVAHRHRAVLLLTDGEPVVVPEGGHLAALLRYKDSCGGALPAIVSTFGFGYALDSVLLRELSEGGQGSFAFIPDSSFTGTVFVHALASLQTTVAADLTVSIEPDSDTQVKRVLGTSPHTMTSWGAQLRFGSALAGQRKDVLVELSRAAYTELTVTLTYTDTRTGTKHTRTGTVTPATPRSPDEERAMEHTRLRLRTTEMIRDAMTKATSKDFAAAVKLTVALSEEIAASAEKKDSYVVDLRKDVDGQVKEAVSKEEFFHKWGRHYLPSLQGAHLSQQCNNFKDPGVQRYISPLFTKLRDILDETFLTLPPPKPSAAPSRPWSTSSSASSSGASPAARAPVSMSSYYSSGNPCFAGSSLVAMADKTFKAVRDVKKGDLVAQPSGHSEVLCVVRTALPSGRTPLVSLSNGLLVTPFHPIRLNGEWAFPCNVSEPREVACDAVYSFVLSRSSSEHLMLINGVECVTLAHSYTAPLVAHAYFGSQRVLSDLKAMPGFESGRVDLVDGCVVRDPLSGLVTGLVHNAQASAQSESA